MAVIFTFLTQEQIDHRDAPRSEHIKNDRFFEFPTNGSDYGVVIYSELGLVGVLPKEGVEFYTYNGLSCDEFYAAST